MTLQYRAIIWPWTMWLTFISLALLLLVILSQPLPSKGTDLLGNLEVYVGTPDITSPQDLEKMAFIAGPADRILTTPQHEIWLRFTLYPTAPPTISPNADLGVVSLLILSSDIDELRLFSPTASDEGWSMRTTGVGQASRDRLRLGTHMSFEFPDLQAPTTYYLRANLPNGGSLSLAALPVQEAALQSNRLLVFAMIYLAALAAGLLILVYHLAEHPSLDVVMLMIGHLGSMLLSLFVLDFPVVLTIGRQLFDNAQGTFTLIALTLLPKMLFHLLFLRRFKPAIWVQRLTLLLFGVLILRVWAKFSSDVYLPTGLDVPLLFMVPIAVTALSLTAKTDAFLPLQSMRKIYLLHGLFLIAILTVRASFIPAHMQFRFVVLAGGLMSSLLIVMLQYVTYHAYDRIRRESMTRLHQSKITHDIAARTLAVQDKLMNMLAHEIRNHLAVAGMSMPKVSAQTDGARQAARAISALDEAVTDCVYANWLHQGEWKVRLQMVNLSELIRPLAGAEVALDLPDQSLGLVDPAMLTMALRNVLRATAGRQPDSITLCAAASSGWQLTVHGKLCDATPLATANPLRSELSLSNARSLVIGMNGKFELTSTQGEWTCRIWLAAR